MKQCVAKAAAVALLEVSAVPFSFKQISFLVDSFGPKKIRWHRKIEDEDFFFLPCKLWQKRKWRSPLRLPPLSVQEPNVKPMSLSPTFPLCIFFSRSLHSNKTKKCNLFYCSYAIYANRFFDALMQLMGKIQLRSKMVFTRKNNNFGLLLMKKNLRSLIYEKWRIMCNKKDSMQGVISVFF